MSPPPPSVEHWRSDDWLCAACGAHLEAAVQVNRETGQPIRMTLFCPNGCPDPVPAIAEEARSDDV